MPTLSSPRRVKTEPRWRAIACYDCAQLPPGQRRWLLDDGSLTERLMGSGDGIFAVVRLHQSWQIPLPSERRLLAMPGRQRALVREVMLTLDARPVVFARSIFPVKSLSGSLAHLRRLRNSSLGAILFRHPAMHRSPFELARLAGNSDYLPVRLHQPTNAWARRSRFDIHGKYLLVSEVFLQSFTPWASPLPVHRTQRGKVDAAFTPATQ